MVFAFWLLVGLLVYTYVGYPLLIRAAAARRPVRKGSDVTTGLGSSELIVVAHNEADSIARKI